MNRKDDEAIQSGNNAEVATAGKKGEENRQDRARRYDRLHNWLFLADIGVMALLLAGLMWGGPRGLSFAIERKVGELIGMNPWGITAGYLVVVSIIYSLLLLPYSWWKDYYLEHTYELSNQTMLNWLWDQVKSWLLTVAVGVFIFEIFYALLRNTGGYWWIWAAGVWILLQVVMGMLFPVIILPIFYKTTRLERQDLEETVKRLAHEAGARIVGIFKLDLSEKTRKANAMLAGLGKTKRILLGDTLLNEFSQEEIISVLAHEFGHYYHRHIHKLIGIASIAALGGMWIADLVLRGSANWLGIEAIDTVATVPLILFALFLFSLVTMPITNLISRWFERQADRYALETTKNPEAFISAMERLADQNLANKEPHPVIEYLLHSHPSIARRISFARAWRSQND